jgi:hypothetical protein
VEASHRLAQAYLHTKRRRGQLQFTDLAVEDLALDCVADLFARDEDGTFPVLKTYFGEATGSDEETHVALRRLVFSKVNESLFRRYREADPGLAKIIRNVKDAVAATEGLYVERRGRRSWVRVGAEGRGAGDRLPIAPPELLEAFFGAAIDHRVQVRDLVRCFVSFVDGHPHYDRGYPITALAQAIRAAFTCVGVADADAGPADPVFHTFEVDEAIRSAVERVGAEKEAQYVGRGKVDAGLYGAYVQAVRVQLEGQYLNGAEPVSNYEALSRQVPDLEEGAYRRDHRNVVEYLGKLARARIAERLSEAA